MMLTILFTLVFAALGVVGVCFCIGLVYEIGDEWAFGAPLSALSYSALLILCACASIGAFCGACHVSTHPF